MPLKKNIYNTYKNITHLDEWKVNLDTSRPENNRLLSLAHRKDVIADHYFPLYTTWESIIHQEADQPIIEDQIRSDTWRHTHISLG